ncbi:hypothetical protein L484_002964 [Morus notabilis]|uniref:Uncharacterized protein n=1 Tax=Morus notabilis TaxID=981085 RepID=W9R2R7_9ROSA|nr:hypothetical protein L484_002964 [Morus notabilis]
MMGPVTKPKVVTIPVPILDREESFDLTADGLVTTPKFVALPRAVVAHKEGFDLKDYGPHYDTKSCHHSCANLRS